MKIIDLLNKIANGEEVPKKIIAGSEECEYFYASEVKDYINVKTQKKLFEDEIEEYIKYFLNDEVEIIGEEKKIPKKIDHLIGYDIRQFDDLKEYVEITTNDLFGKINKVIDTLNEIIDYIKSKEE